MNLVTCNSNFAKIMTIPEVSVDLNVSNVVNMQKGLIVSWYCMLPRLSKYTKRTCTNTKGIPFITAPHLSIMQYTPVTTHSPLTHGLSMSLYEMLLGKSILVIPSLLNSINLNPLYGLEKFLIFQSYLPSITIWGICCPWKDCVGYIFGEMLADG